jgi:glutathione S-transferase
MKIYGSIFSPFVCRVVLAARYKGLKHELIMPEGGMKTKEYLAINPFAKMPALKDKSTVIPESSVIIEYIDAKYPKRRIIPATPKAAATARLLASVTDQYLQTSILALFRQRDPKTQDKKLVKSTIKEIGDRLDIVSSYLSDTGNWACGSRFTIADCYLMPALFFMNILLPGFGLKDPFGNHKKIKKYWNKLKKDPLTKQAMREMSVVAKTFMK